MELFGILSDTTDVSEGFTSQVNENIARPLINANYNYSGV